jgi:TolA-binding protein
MLQSKILLKNFPRLVLLTLLVSNTSCGLLQRSPRATNTEDPKQPATHQPLHRETNDDEEELTLARPLYESNEPVRPLERFAEETTPPPQHIPRDQQHGNTSQEAFALALQSQNDAAFQEASTRWKEFLTRYPGAPGTDQARYNLALCEFHLGNQTESLEHLKSVLSQSNDDQLATEARLLLAENFIRLHRWDEALALTYEVFPDRNAERSSGIHRRSAAPQVKPLQAARLYLLRARIQIALGEDKLAGRSIENATKMVRNIKSDKLTSSEQRRLEAYISWYRIEHLNLTCSLSHSSPDRLSEAEFLDYAKAYYNCAAPARTFICEAHKVQDEQIKSQALSAYKTLAEAPLKIRDKLPEPTRPVRTKEQREFYERDMKALIERTVQQYSSHFKNVAECRLTHLF